MTTAIFSSSNIAPAQPSNVGVALREFGLATQRLGAALWTAFVSRTRSTPSQMSAAEEAQELRVFASSIAASDPSFASDLFAAADRHEYGDNA